MPRPSRITVVTSGHLSTCPRMVKAADALSADGHDVRVVATRHETWATTTDGDLMSRRAWPLTTVDYRRQGGGSTYWRTGVRYRAAGAAVRALGPDRLPSSVLARAFGRVHTELVDAAIANPADLIYGGTTGALAAVAEAAHRLRIPYAVDLEDLHHGEASDPSAALSDRLAEQIERRVIGGAAFVTTSSEAIGSAYHDRYAVAPAVIHNTFPLPHAAPAFTRPDATRLRVYWFSQTIGRGRGLEDAIVALGRAGTAAELVLRGRPLDGYLDALTGLAARHAPLVFLVHQPPAPPDTMIDLARGFDVGLALEELAPRNRQLCMTNKTFTYVLAGVAVVISDTPGQHSLGVDLGCAAAVVPPGDINALAAAFASWMQEPARLECAKRAAWQAGVRRWHWEHELERGQLCRLVRATLGAYGPQGVQGVAS